MLCYGMYVFHTITQKTAEIIKPAVILTKKELLGCSIAYDKTESKVELLDSKGKAIFQGSLKNAKNSAKTIANLYAIFGQKDVIKKNKDEKLNYSYINGPSSQ